MAASISSHIFAQKVSFLGYVVRFSLSLGFLGLMTDSPCSKHTKSLSFCNANAINHESLNFLSQARFVELKIIWLWICALSVCIATIKASCLSLQYLLYLALISPKDDYEYSLPSLSHEVLIYMMLPCAILLLLMCMQNRFCKCAGLKQSKCQKHGISHHAPKGACDIRCECHTCN